MRYFDEVLFDLEQYNGQLVKVEAKAFPSPSGPDSELLIEALEQLQGDDHISGSDLRHFREVMQEIAPRRRNRQTEFATKVTRIRELLHQAFR